MRSKIPHYHGATPNTFKNAKLLRKNSTSAEDLFWQMARNRKILGLKFRRQHPLNYFIADFYCHEALLVIEIDGGIHDLEEVKQRDIQREKIINELGITVIRCTNDELFTEPDTIVKRIENYLENKIKL